MGGVSGLAPLLVDSVTLTIRQMYMPLCSVSVHGESAPVKSIRSTYTPCIVETVGGAIKMSYYDRSHMLYTAAPGLTPHSTNLL